MSRQWMLLILFCLMQPNSFVFSDSNSLHIVYNSYPVIPNTRAIGENFAVTTTSLVQCVVYCQLKGQCSSVNYLSLEKRCEMFLGLNKDLTRLWTNVFHWKYVSVTQVPSDTSNTESSKAPKTLTSTRDKLNIDKDYLSTLSGLSTLAKTTPRCQTEFEELGGGCYYFARSPVVVGRSSAQSRCYDFFGANLASVETAEEFTLLNNHLLSIYSSIATACVNGWIVNAERTHWKNPFQWYTGSYLSTSGTMWIGGKSGDEYCLSMYPPNMQFKDIWCRDVSRQFICEA